MTDEPARQPSARSSRRLWIGIAAVVLGLPVLLYVLLFWRWHAVKPEVTFDFLAELNAPALAVPEGERAWPMLREAWAAAGVWDLEVPQVWPGVGWGIAPARDRRVRTYLGPAPVDPVTWLAAHRDLVEAGRRSADFEGFGWLASWGERSQEEADAFDGGRDPHGVASEPEDDADRLVRESAIGVLLPALSTLRTHARVLALDAGVAAAAGGGQRWLADLAGIEALARFTAETPTLINGIVSLSLLDLHNAAVEEALRAGPAGLDAATLSEIADRLAAQRLRGVLHVEGQRQAFRDTLQHTHGPGPGGRLNATGWAVLNRFSYGGTSGGDTWLKRGQRLVDPLRLLWTATREEERSIHDGYLVAVEVRLREPAREASGPGPSVEAGFEEPGFATRHPTLAVVAVAMDELFLVQERALGRQDAARLAVALARFRLVHGAWPETLDPLVPTFMAELPADRITGGALRYAVRDDRPVVWSVGADGDDDGGVPPADGSEAAAVWGEAAASPPDGDWVLLLGEAV